MQTIVFGISRKHGRYCLSLGLDTIGFACDTKLIISCEDELGSFLPFPG